MPSRPHSRRRVGFTLIELLVVIAIIAILIGLLLPAVQKVREAAARTQCTNNLKQWGIALHAYHDTFSGFPAGSAALSGTGAWGYSWIANLLPQIEQAPMYSQFTFTRSVWSDPNQTNSRVANNFTPKIFFCPSSSLPTGTSAGAMNGGINEIYPTTNYVGIAGSVSDPSNRLTAAGGAGISSGGGVLFANSKVRIADITDGTTNQIMVGEQGDWLIQTGGGKVDWRASLPHSAFMGFDQAGTPQGGNMNNDNRVFNTTTVRYVLNDKKNQGSGGNGWSGNCASDGVCFNEGNSNPINSAHTGGVMFLFGDGSVKFLRDSTDLATLKLIATRDDGGVVTLN